MHATQRLLGCPQPGMPQQLALINWTSLKPYFSYQSEEVIKATYQVTSRYVGTVPTNDYSRNT